MSENKFEIYSVHEQLAIFVGGPYFTPGGMIMQLLNYYAEEGGTTSEVMDLREEGLNANLYKVRIVIEVAKIDI